MELTLNSAFSVGGLIGQLAYFLLIAAMFMRTMRTLRFLVIASGLVALFYSFFWQYDPITMFWHAVLILVNVYQITQDWLTNRRARFSAEEQKFVQDRLYTLPPGEARQLLNMGVWADGAVGTRLTTQGKPVDNLVYLVDGEVDIRFAGAAVGACLPG